MITKINNINNYTKHEINNFRNGKIKIGNLLNILVMLNYTLGKLEKI